MNNTIYDLPEDEIITIKNNDDKYVDITVKKYLEIIEKDYPNGEY